MLHLFCVWGATQPVSSSNSPRCAALHHTARQLIANYSCFTPHTADPILESTAPHVEIMKGQPKQARDYCIKDDTRLPYDKYVDYCQLNGIEPRGTQGPYEVGDCPGPQGRRSDLSNFTDEMKAGRSLAEVALENPTVFVKYHSGFQKLAFYMNQDASSQWRTVNVEVLYGATGVGKTRGAIELANKDTRGWFLMRKDDGKTLWWDGYTGQTTIILDEFHGNWCTYKGLLGILDGHPFRVPIKGGHEWARWTTVYITSSTDYKGWYSRTEYSELERRINKRTHVDPLAAMMPPEARSGGNTSPTSSGGLLPDQNPPPSPMLLDLGTFSPVEFAVLDNMHSSDLYCDEDVADILADLDKPMTTTSTYFGNM